MRRTLKEMARSELYPEIQPYETGMLPVSTLHQIYWEQVGKPNGVPVVFLHGGPGAGANPTHRRFFDPSHYRVIIFDQRGSGRSRPLGETRDNTTPLLIEDIETLRRKLGIERWIVFGGSWGSTLALAYAEAHPERCLALVLRGIFLCRRSEIDWFLYGIRTFFPEHWRAFAGHIPEAQRDDLLKAYYRLLLDPDPAVHMPAARIWSTYEGACSTLLPSAETVAVVRTARTRGRPPPGMVSMPVTSAPASTRSAPARWACSRIKVPARSESTTPTVGKWAPPRITASSR